MWGDPLRYDNVWLDRCSECSPLPIKVDLLNNPFKAVFFRKLLLSMGILYRNSSITTNWTNIRKPCRSAWLWWRSGEVRELKLCSLLAKRQLLSSSYNKTRKKALFNDVCWAGECRTSDDFPSTLHSGRPTIPATKAMCCFKFSCLSVQKFRHQSCLQPSTKRIRICICAFACCRVSDNTDICQRHNIPSCPLLQFDDYAIIKGFLSRLQHTLFVYIFPCIVVPWKAADCKTRLTFSAFWN